MFFRRKKFPARAFKEHTYHPYIHYNNIYPILHYPPLILSRSLRSLANKLVVRSNSANTWRASKYMSIGKDDL